MSLGTVMEFVVVTVGVVGLAWLTLRRSCVVCPEGKRVCVATCGEVAEKMGEPVPSGRVERLMMVMSVEDALVCIEATQGMHMERLRYQAVTQWDGSRVVEVYKVVEP